MTDHGTTIEALRCIVAGVVGPKRATAVDMTTDTPQGEGGLWMDSVELLEVIVACETAFGIIFEPAKDLVGDSLDTLGTLAALISARTRQARRPLA